MSTTVSDGRQSRGGEIPGDWERWLAAQGGDNEERLQRLRAIYPAGILFTGAASILYTVQGLGAAVPVLDGVLSAVPLAEVGLGWVLPALAGVLLGAVLSLQRESKEVR